MTVSVDIGVACSSSQSHSWWTAIMSMLLSEQASGIDIRQIIAVGSAVPDYNKNVLVGASVHDKRRLEKTDVNRNEIVKNFINGGDEGPADYLFMIDDDTVPPRNVLSYLIGLQKDLVAGLYFNPKPPYNPIAYVRNKNGIGYFPLYDYPFGTLIPVDSVGMGCTLIHRSVFERIREEHRVFVRPNGSLFPVHVSQIYNLDMPQLQDRKEDVIISNGWALMKVDDPPEDDTRNWPYFSMEYVRTEDHHFCELAANVGIRPWVDTRINCKHYKLKATDYSDYRRHINELNNLV